MKHPVLQDYPERFFKYYEVCKSSFEKHLCKIKNCVMKSDINMRQAISPEKMLSVTLRKVIFNIKFYSSKNSRKN